MAKGKRISGRKASTESYMKFYQFLMYEEKYRKMSSDAKVLYTLLRDRYNLSILTTTEDNDTFLDNEGNLYCIMENSEMELLLNRSGGTVVKAKQELVDAGLLEVVLIPNGASLLYVLEPEGLESTVWSFKAQIEELKLKKQQSKERSEQRKQGEIRESKNRIPEKWESKNRIPGNLKIESYKDLSFTKIDLVSKLVSQYGCAYKVTPYVKENLKTFLKDSGEELLEFAIEIAIRNEVDKPVAYIKSILANWKQRGFTTKEDVLKAEEERKVQQLLERQKKENQPKRKPSRSYQSGRKEMLPKWLEKQNEGSMSPKEETPEEAEQRQKLEEALKGYKRA